MGMRPTIAVCYDGHIVDILCYKDVGIGSLIYCAFKTYVCYKDCKNASEFLEKRTAEIREKYPDYKRCDDSEESMIQFARWSDFPLIVDMTKRCVYHGIRPVSRRRLNKRKDSREMMATIPPHKQWFITSWIIENFAKQCVFWLDKLDLNEIFRLGEISGNGFFGYYW